MRQVKGSNKVISNDRTAIMAGLNLAHELILSRRHGGPDLSERLEALSEQVASALNNDTESEV